MKKIAVAIFVFAVLTVSLSLLINNSGAKAETPADATYVENKKCKMCHLKQFKAHSETAHAKSFENLTDAGEEANKECYPCHTTGYGKPGGFTDVASTPDLVGTTCQACHGPGSAHVAKGLSKEERKPLINGSPKDACVNCHKQHEEHVDIGAKAVPALKRKIEMLQAKITELGG
jgi:hypothetical protein